MKNETKHVAVWIDHNEAKIFHVDDASFDPVTVTPRHHVKRHPTQTAEHEHPADVRHFFEAVARALGDAVEVLVVGPGSAKLELVKHVQAHDHALASKIVGVETADHPTDGQLTAHARKYFHGKDRLLGTVR